jgi:hypothetical protein
VELPPGDDNRHASLQQFYCQLGQALEVAFRPPRLDGDVLAFDIAGLFESLPESG